PICEGTHRVIDPSLVSGAHALADAADAIARRYFRAPVKSLWKEDATPVTLADQEIERAIRAIIAERWPTHGIFGEEEGQHNISADYVWVIDPIDGTRSFMAGKPQFATLIALCHKSIPVLGIVSQAITKERWLGIAGQPSLLNGDQIRTRSCHRMEEGWLATTSPHYFTDDGKRGFSHVQRLAKETLYGGDAYNYALLAGGGLDAVIEEGLKPYDALALAPIIAGAGGCMTDWQGLPLTITMSGRVLASATPQLAAQLQALLK